MDHFAREMQKTESPEQEDGSAVSSRSGSSTSPEGYDLRFVWLEQNRAGGWYREFPDATIEVMSHAQLQHVPLGGADPEQKAREIVAEIVRHQEN